MRWHWRWVHILMGIAFLARGIWAFANPLGTFWALATVIGLLLILQGAFVLITSIESRDHYVQTSACEAPWPTCTGPPPLPPRSASRALMA